MRKKKLIYNTISSLIFQVTTIVCGFILPRLILNAFGSNVNGLVNSITQFLGIISFLELGVGAVVQSALYKPLAENRQNDVSKIISSANKFFRRLAQILMAYVIALVVFYPMFAAKEYGFWYTATLIVAGQARHEQEAALWSMLLYLQGCVFLTAKGLKFTYKIKGGEMFVNRKSKSITQATIFIAFRKAMEFGGVVAGPKKLGTFGASYLYPIFVRLGVIRGDAG